MLIQLSLQFSAHVRTSLHFHSKTIRQTQHNQYLFFLTTRFQRSKIKRKSIIFWVKRTRNREKCRPSKAERSFLGKRREVLFRDHRSVDSRLLRHIVVKSLRSTCGFLKISHNFIQYSIFVPQCRVRRKSSLCRRISHNTISLLSRNNNFAVWLCETPKKL